MKRIRENASSYRGRLTTTNRKDDVSVRSQLYTDLVNEFRLKQNLQPLVMNEAVMTLAQNHTDYMAERDNLSHIGIGSLSYFERIHQIGVYVPFENVGALIIGTYTNIFDVHTRWISWPVFRPTLLIEHFNQVGFGAVYKEDSQYQYYYQRRLYI